MKPVHLLAGLLIAALAIESAQSQTTIISDNYDIATSGTGFALGAGVNTGINPPTTRLTGTAAPNLRYLQVVLARDPSNFAINANRLRVTTTNAIGRFTLSANGSTAFDFGPALGSPYAAPTNPALYDVKISMRNNAPTTPRFSFALGTVETDANGWDFGVQLYRATGTDDFYTIQKRIDAASSGAGDLNQVMTNTASGTWVTNGQATINFLIRVTDAGAESGTNYNSRIQVSLDNGANWVYDTQTDASLPNGFRFDGAARIIDFDQANNTTGPVFYDNFSIESTFAPPPPSDLIWTGGGTDDLWSNAANWGGTPLVDGTPIVFNGATRTINTNDFTTLTVPSVTFSNGGFTLYGLPGNSLTISGPVSNIAGLNIFGGDLTWSTTSPKTWGLAAGSEVQLNNVSSVEVNGDHSIVGGGTLRVRGTMNIGQLTSANPPFLVNEGTLIVDGGTFTSRGGHRIGSVATGAGAQTILTNGAAMSLTAAAANLRVGDSANPITSRLVINNSTLTMAGGVMGIPLVAGATGEVAQVGGVVSGATLNFSQSGAGMGTYTIQNGGLEAVQIKKATASGLARMFFDNAVLRTAPGANITFFAGLDLAEIQAGGLKLDAQSDVTIDQVLSGSGGLIKSNVATVTLTGANTYSGSTIIQSGKLILPTIQTNSTSIQAGDATELGVTVTGVGTTLSVTALNFAGASFGTLSFDLGTFGLSAAPLMQVTSLSVNGPVTVNVVNGNQWAIGQFPLVDYSGAIGGGFQFTLGSLPPGVTATLVNNTANSSIDLNITSYPGYVPAPAITNVFASGGNIIFSGTGGTAGNPFTVMSSTNINLPVANWTPVFTNTFGPGGTFVVTNMISEPATFFRVRVP